MLEQCVERSNCKSALRKAAVNALSKWQLAGGCTTDHVCRCCIGGAPNGNADGLGITAENAADRWWQVNFDWLDE
jgi:hypothetical protein